MLLGATTAVGGTRSYDEVAFYRREIGIARIQAHYTAGVNRGYPAQDPGARITAVLADSQSIAPTSIRAGSREMHPEFMAGRDVLSTIRRGEEADNVDAVLFVAADGTITFLDDGHRSVSPWNTVQATFDDDGTDLPYLDVNIDYSEAFLYNEVNATRNQGTTTTNSDATSISRYFKRGLSLTDLPLTTDADVSAIATALLAKYKDPMTRIVSLTLDTSVDAVTAAVLPLEIGDRIRVFRSPPGGGARIDQTLFVQKIQIDAANDGAPWRIQLGVSPL
jgi:hypothetical protein